MSLDITPVVPAGRQLIGGYGDGGFSIAGVRHEGAVFVFAERTEPWDAPDAHAVSAVALSRILDDGQAGGLVLVGCGPAFVPPPKGLRAELKALGRVLEWMDTGAACRTFNVLLAEGRPVVAALLPA